MRNRALARLLVVLLGGLLFALLLALSTSHAQVICNRFGCSDTKGPGASYALFRSGESGPTVRRTMRRARPFDANGNGVVRSHKTGATARVSPRYAGRFQAYVNDLEAHGARVAFMGGFRKGRCSIPRHKHPCGLALDVCQKDRGRVAGYCHLPSPTQMIAIAARHGLTEGASWRDSDYGHAEVPTYDIANR